MHVIDPSHQIGQVDCTCTFNVETEFDVLCTVSRCQCDALSRGACAAPRDEAACREQLADAIDTCGALAPFIERPDPADIQLPLIDTYCGHFFPASCNLVFNGSFCTGQDLVSGQERQACEPVCATLAAFVENKLSNQDSRLVCGSVHTVNVRGVAGRKEECGLECPDIRCDETNLETCTHVINRLRGCQGGFDGDVICRAPDSDPPQLAAGGVLANMITRRTTVELNPTTSFISFAGSFAGQLGVSGRVDLLGETCVGCAASIHLSALAGGVSVQNIEIDQIHLSAGTGTSPVIAIDAVGHGSILPNAIDGTLSMRVNGVPQFLTTKNTTGVELFFDRNTGSFTLDGEITAERDGVTASGHLHLSGEMTNQPPTVSADQSITVECTSPQGAPLTLHATTADPDGPFNLLSVGWSQITDAGSTSVAPWFDASITAPPGVSTWQFTATDRGLQSNTTNTQVTVRDTVAPTVTLAQNLCLSPANHKYIVLDARRDLVRRIVDACDEEPTIRILSATSNEPDNGTGDGDTDDDIVLVDDNHVCLRAERAGGRDSRIYSLELEVSDSSGNRSVVTQQVVVPHDQSHQHCDQQQCGHRADNDDVECRARTPSGSTPPPSSGHGPRHGCNIAPSLVLGICLALFVRRRRP